MTIYEKLGAVQSKLKAPKNRKNTFGGYSYRSCEDILEAVKPLLEKNKASIKITDNMTMIGARYYVNAQAYFIDNENPGEFIVTEAYAREPEEKKGMDPAQITGSASSYARKYALNGLLLIDDVKDPDTDEIRVEQDAKTAKADKAKAPGAQKKSAECDHEKRDDSLISHEDAEAIRMLLRRADISEEKFNSIYKLEDLDQLPREKYDDAVRKLWVAVKEKDKEGK